MNLLQLEREASAAVQPANVGHAPLANMSRCLQTMMDLMEAPETSPRIGTFFGFSGYGKTTAAAYTAARFQHLYIQALPIWSAKSFLQALAVELGIAKPARDTTGLLEQIFDVLRRQPRGLIIDEFDYLLHDRFIELVRSIHDNTPTPILLIGEEKLPSELQKWERFHNRILVATPANPCSETDVLALRDNYCQRVNVADDLAIHIGQQCKGITRRISTNLMRVERTARTEGAETIDRAWWGNRELLTGDVPVRRAMGFGA